MLFSFPSSQTYVSGTLVYVFVEMFIFSVYYRYLNKHGLGAGSTAFLLVVAILNAGRNSLSFFLLLVVVSGISSSLLYLSPSEDMASDRVLVFFLLFLFRSWYFSLFVCFLPLICPNLVHGVECCNSNSR